FTPSAAATRSGDSEPPATVSPIAIATVTGTSSGSDNGASSATQTPSVNSDNSPRATSRPSRVFPTPPVPINVTSLWTDSASVTSSTAGARTISSDVDAGRFVGDVISTVAVSARGARLAMGSGLNISKELVCTGRILTISW